MSKKKSRATRLAESQRAAERAAAIRAEQERSERRRRTLVVGGLVVVVLAFILVIGYAVQASRDTTGASAAAPQGAAGFGLPVGKKTAPVSVTIYEDPICPFCGQFETASRWVQQYLDAGKVRISYHMIAFLNGDSTTKYSERAANAMAAVYDTSGPTVAKKFHDLLYLHQPPEGTAGLANSQLVAYAVRAGAPRAAISAAVSHGSFDQWVVNATDAMSKAGVTGTPTVFVDGHRLPENLSTTALSTSLKRQIDAKTP